MTEPAAVVGTLLSPEGAEVCPHVRSSRSPNGSPVGECAVNHREASSVP
jgi:hypothetical protein